MLKQLSIYAENKKGALQTMTNALYEAGINIWGSVTNDGTEYGINRMVVSDPDKAKEVLTERGYLCRFVDVLAVVSISLTSSTSRVPAHSCPSSTAD